MNIKEDILQYVQELTSETIQDTKLNLFEHGYLTSLDVLDLVSFIEEKFQFNISEEDLDMKNMGTIDDIVKLITSNLPIN